MLQRLTVVTALLAFSGCVADVATTTDNPDGDDDSDLIDTSDAGFSTHVSYAGVNGDVCKASKFNCHVRDGGSRVTTPANANTDQRWAIAAGEQVYDGEGTALHAETGASLVFNYGMLKTINGREMALAMASSNGSSAWFPVDHIVDRATFLANDRAVNAKTTGEAHLSCYTVRNSDNTAIELRKVVYNSHTGIDGHERAGDYMSLVRANGKRSANLAYVVPGFALGGETSDHVLAGTRFQRVTVPTDTGAPSISIPLYVKDSAGAFKKKDGAMRFIYGFTRTAGVARFGWMSMDALTATPGECP